MKTRLDLVGFLSFFAVFVSASWAQVAMAPPSAELKARHEKIYAKIGADGVALICSARQMRGYDPFRQNNRFFYLSGLESYDCYLILNGRQRTSRLLVPTRDRRAAWEGPNHPPIDQLKQRCGVTEVKKYKRLKDELAEVIKASKAKKIFMPFAPEEIRREINDSLVPLQYAHRASSGKIDSNKGREESMTENLKKAFPKCQVLDLSPFIRQLRLSKSPYEIAMMRKACEISVAAMKEVLGVVRPGQFEFELAAANEYRAALLGAQGPAYKAIVGSGPNSCVVHHNRNNRKILDGDIVVVDAGSSYDYYVADITRTFPANGRFSPEQKRLYEVVLLAQETAIKACKPGVTLDRLNRMVRAIFKEHKIDQYILHGLGHSVGMAVHDPRAYFAKLKPGHVITIEPGAYIKSSALGVRIEDVVLVTETGCEVLSRDLPKTVAEIEAFMAAARDSKTAKQPQSKPRAK